MTATITASPKAGTVYIGTAGGHQKTGKLSTINATILVEHDESGRVIGMEIESVRLAMILSATEACDVKVG